MQKVATTNSSIEEQMIQTELMMEKVDQPLHSSLRDSNQRYVVLSIVAPSHTHQRNKEVCVRVYRILPTTEEANALCASLRDEDDTFDYYVAEANEWLALPPHLEQIEDTHYHDDRVNTMLNGYKEDLKVEREAQIRRLETAQMEKQRREEMRQERQKKKELGVRGKKKLGVDVVAPPSDGLEETKGEVRVNEEVFEREEVDDTMEEEEEEPVEPEEADGKLQWFVPQTGDSEKTLEMKAKLFEQKQQRLQAMETMKQDLLRVTEEQKKVQQLMGSLSAKLVQSEVEEEKMDVIAEKILTQE